MGGAVDSVPEPEIDASGKRDDVQLRVIGADRDSARAFRRRWRPRLEAMPNARHRSMLRVIIGETLEHERFFEQARAGRTDLLGRRADGAGTGGGVIRREVDRTLRVPSASAATSAIAAPPSSSRGAAAWLRQRPVAVGPHRNRAGR
jgi:hypothetical protein